MKSKLELLQGIGRPRQWMGLMAGMTALLLPVAAEAQRGCVHSPECPTAVLGLVGAGGAALFARWRTR